MGFREYFTVEVLPMDGVPEEVAAVVTVKDWEWQREDVDELVAFLGQVSGSTRKARVCGRLLRETQQSGRHQSVGLSWLSPVDKYNGMMMILSEGEWLVVPRGHRLEKAMVSA